MAGDDHWRIRALIRQQALINNINAIRGICGSTEIYAVVKADAYGHGISGVARCSHLIDGFAVATLDEGIALRALLPPDKPVIVLSEFNHASQIALYRRHQLQFVIHRQAQLEWLEQDSSQASSECGPETCGAWIKFDTGMGRLGLPAEHADELIRRFMQLSNVRQCGVMSHLASADDSGSPQTKQQFALFRKLQLPQLAAASLSNSAGLVTIGTDQQTMVRPGILLFGISPMSSAVDPGLDLQPVMILQSRLIDVKLIRQGESVGYGATWQAPSDGKIGIVSCGYADGYPRLAGNRGYVIVQNIRADIVGRISMDTMAINLTDNEQAAAGDIVELWGTRIPVSQVAKWAETIPYELLCQVGNRVPRVAVD